MKKTVLYICVVFFSCYENRGNHNPLVDAQLTVNQQQHITNEEIIKMPDVNYFNLKNYFEKKYKNWKPRHFSPWQKGLVRSINTKEKIVALTFDACGTKRGLGYDRKLIEFLIQNKIPATLFMSGVWIDHNPVAFRGICGNQLFDIGNHGLLHRPLSINGQWKYKIKGTKNVSELMDEVVLNSKKIEMICGRKPVFFRAGTACYDDVAIRILYELKYIPINYSILPGDFDYGSNEWQMAYRIIRWAKNGSIILMHMNHPKGKTYKAVKFAVATLQKKGYRFVKLSDYVKFLKD